MRIPDQLDLPLDGGPIREIIKSLDQRWNGRQRNFSCGGCGQINHPARAFHDATHGIKVPLGDSDHAMMAKSDSAPISGANTAINLQGGSHV